MRVVWTRTALSQVVEIEDYIAEDNPAAAFALVQKIRKRVETQLPAHPYSGRPGEHFPDTRELVISGTRFIVVYRVKEDVIEILQVRHSSQQWPPDDEDFSFEH